MCLLLDGQADALVERLSPAATGLVQERSRGLDLPVVSRVEVALDLRARGVTPYFRAGYGEFVEVLENFVGSGYPSPVLSL